MASQTLENNDTEFEENKDPMEEQEKPNEKKRRKFFAKEFRQNLLTKNANEAVKNFVQLCSEENTSQDYAFEYLESGGNCSEILRVIEMSENKNTSFILPIFQAFNIVLLKIISSSPHKQMVAEEACRELLNKHYSIVKSMLSLTSNTKQRKIGLKLLSTMVTMSPGLAKEVLAHASFDKPILEVLSQPSKAEDGNTVRTSFIHFLISFLLEGSTATILTFLEKRGLLSSIFHGLLYDTPGTVNLVLSTIQTKVLEDKMVSKTIKMNTFTTQVVQNIVNLYNWKGPSNWQPNRRTKTVQSIVVDKDEKQKVCECAHRFLLVLCTSHKYGIVFHDPTIGLGSKKHNQLMSTVLQSLEKPWDNYLASELVIKICVSCPDLVKYILSHAEPFLEPRVSHKWVNVVNFIQQLIEQLVPQCVEQFLSQLNIKQIVIIIQTFCVPKAVLQVITSDTMSHEHIGIRHKSILLLSTMLESVDRYLSTVNSLTTFTTENKQTLKGLVVDYLNKNLPPASVLLNDWRKSVTASDELLDPSVPVPELYEHLSKLLDILYKYNILCPQLVDHITKELNTNEFLQTIENLCADNMEVTAEMQMKAINLLLICDVSLFIPSTELFAYVLPLLLKLYFQMRDSLQAKVESTLCQLFNITGMFEGCSEEIMVWLYAILEQDSYSDDIGNFLVFVVKTSNKNFLKYVQQLTSLKESTSDESYYNARKVIESLHIDVDRAIQCVHERQFHVMLSPLFLGFLDTLTTESDNVKISPYINTVLINLLHSQTSPILLIKLILDDKYNSNFDKHTIKYYKSWTDCSALVSVKKSYVSNSPVVKLNKYLINDEQDSDINTLLEENTEWRHYYCITLTKLIIFYLSQLASKRILTEVQQKKCLSSVIYLLNKCNNANTLFACLDYVLKHPVLLQNFTTAHDTKQQSEKYCTAFTLNIIQELLKTKTKSELETYLNAYRMKLVRELLLMLKKCGKNKEALVSSGIMDVVKLFDLTYEQCSELLKIIADIPSICLISEQNCPSTVVELVSYTLTHYQKLNTNNAKIKPFDNEIISKISDHVIHLNKHSTELNLDDLESSICQYVKQFTHSNISFSTNFFESLIRKSNINKTGAKLASQLLKCNLQLLDSVSSSLGEIMNKRELIFSLLNAVVNSDSEIVKSLLSKVYKEHEQIIMKFLNKPQKVANYLIDNYKVVVKLLNDCMSVEQANSFSIKSHKFDVTEIYHAEILTTVYNKSIMAEKSEPSKCKYICNYITTLMNMLINTLKRAEKSDEDWNKIENITSSLSTYIIRIKNVYRINYVDENLCKSAAFQTFSKLGLKFGLQGNPSLINTLKQLCQLTEESNTDMGILFEMAVSHSETLNILLSASDLKTSLLSLLLVLCKKCPNVKAKAHIPVWLGAYGATVSQSDQCLLQLLALYEEAGIGFHEYRPYLWGKAAVGHYSVRFGVETTLWRQPKPKEVLDIFDENKIRNTITHFPRSRILKPDQPLYSDDTTDVYDPAFYLPLLSHLLAPESTIRWYQCTQRGIIALVIVALTSESEEIRAAACHVLARFHSHIEGARFGKQRLLWLHLVEAVCRGTSTLENLRLSTIAAVFLSRCALVFTMPNHPLYTALGHYFMAKECPDLSVVPELLPMLHSTDVSHNVHRHFILEVIRDGLHTENDLKVMFRSVTFKLLMDLYNSVLIDYEAQRIILEILRAAVSIPNGARTLVSGYSLISWLDTVLSRLTPSDTEQLRVIIHVVNNLISAYEDDHLKYIQFSVLLLLVSAMDLLKTARVKLQDLVTYVKLLYKLYKYNPCVMTRTHLSDLLNICLRFMDCNVCNYYLDYGSKFVEQPVLESNETDSQGCYYLKMLTLKWLQENKCDNST